MAAVLLDPLEFASMFWPDIRFYTKQKEILYSVRDDEETFVPAGNMLGKDFVTGFVVLWFFLSRHPVRIVTTSADHAQLQSVLWGEIRRFLSTSRAPLDASKGGPILVNHLHLRKVIGRDLAAGGMSLATPSAAQGNGKSTDKTICGLSYCIGRVAAKGEGMLGHHIADQGDGIPRTLFVADEASGVEDEAYERADTWARRKLIIGNCYQGPPGCTFFKKGCQEGNKFAEE